MNKWKAIVDTGATFTQTFFYYAGEDPVDLTGWTGAFKFFSSSGAPLLELGSPGAYGGVVVDDLLGKLSLSVTTQGTPRLTGRTGTYELWITDGTTTLRLLDGPAQYRQGGSGSLDNVNVIISRTTSAVTVERATINQIKIVDRGPPGKKGDRGLSGLTDPVTYVANGAMIANDKRRFDEIDGARKYLPPPTGLPTAGADDAIVAAMCADCKSGTYPGGLTYEIGPYRYEISPNTHNIDGTVGVHIIGSGGDFLRGTVFSTQSTGRAFGMDSCALCSIDNVNFECTAPLAVDTLLTCDGGPLASDGASCTFNCLQFRQPDADSTATMATVVATGGGPTVTLERDGSSHYTHFRMVVEIQSATTFRYSTSGGARTGANGSDGLGDGVWQATGQTIPLAGGTFALAGMMQGLKLRFAVGTYNSSHSYRASAGVKRWIHIAQSFCCVVDGVTGTGGYDGVYLSGVGNCARLGATSRLGRYAIITNCTGGEAVQRGPEPGGDSNGRGGTWVAGSLGAKVTLNSGDAMATGPWVRVTQSFGTQIDGAYGVNAGAAILLENGSTGTRVKGDYTFCPTIVDTLGASINDGVWIEASYLGVEGNAITGVHYDNFTIRTQAIQRVQKADFNVANVAFFKATGAALPATNEVNVGYYGGSPAIVHGAGASGGGILAFGSPTGQHADIPTGSVVCVALQTAVAAGWAFMVYDAAHANKMVPGLFVGPAGSLFTMPGGYKALLSLSAASDWEFNSKTLTKVRGASNQNLSFSATLAALTSETKTVAITGAAVGDTVRCNARAALPDAVNMNCWVSATDTVSVKVYNGLAAATVDLSGARFDFTLVRPG